MRSSRDTCAFDCPTQAELDGFRRPGISWQALAKPWAMQVAHGHVGQDGRFEPDAAGERWFAFEEVPAGDFVFWHRGSERLASWCGRAFALGEPVIDEAATYSFDGALNIFVDPIDWLRAGRDGIVVLPDRWPVAFDRLRDCPRIALAEPLLPVYRRFMRPQHLPALMIVPPMRRAA